MPLSAAVRGGRGDLDQLLCHLPMVDHEGHKSRTTPTPREKAGLFILHDGETATAE